MIFFDQFHVVLILGDDDDLTEFVESDSVDRAARGADLPLGADGRPRLDPAGRRALAAGAGHRRWPLRSPLILGHIRDALGDSGIRRQRGEPVATPRRQRRARGPSFGWGCCDCWATTE